ncbi:MAG: hypothetical protein ACK4GG_01265 [Sphingomonas sp.]
MDNIREQLKAVGARYNKSLPHYDACIQLVSAAYRKLEDDADFAAYGRFAGKPAVDYYTFSNNFFTSRPVRPDIYISSYDELIHSIEQLSRSLENRPSRLNNEDIETSNRVVYTAVMSVACCYDLWQRGSRKTPGTFFEFLMAALLQKMLPAAVFSKHISLASLLNDTETGEGVPVDIEALESDEEEGGAASVSTDLVIGMPDRRGGVVIPLKITTRERIVQPFAHQRILNSAFGEAAYQSLLVCISETQLDEKTRSVKQVCVPGTVKLFQKYLAPIGGLYYCDIPQRYFAADMQKIIPVKSVGDFFRDLAKIMELNGQL